MHTSNRRSLNLRLATGLSKTTGERDCVGDPFFRGLQL
jgi:hypothetical protein